MSDEKDERTLRDLVLSAVEGQFEAALDDAGAQSKPETEWPEETKRWHEAYAWAVNFLPEEPMSDKERERILAEAAKTECCKRCFGSGRVLESDDSVLKTTCLVCLGMGRVDKQQRQ